MLKTLGASREVLKTLATLFHPPASLCPSCQKFIEFKIEIQFNCLELSWELPQDCPISPPGSSQTIYASMGVHFHAPPFPKVDSSTSQHTGGTITPKQLQTATASLWGKAHAFPISGPFSGLGMKE